MFGRPRYRDRESRNHRTELGLAKAAQVGEGAFARLPERIPRSDNFFDGQGFFRRSRLYGQGEATFTGRLAGTARWSNYPRLRGDWAFPEARGVIEVTGGGFVLFSLTGMSSLTSGSGVHVLTFQTADAAHGWLNDIIAIGEGSIDPDRGLLAMRYYACTADYLPGIEARADH